MTRFRAYHRHRTGCDHRRNENGSQAPRVQVKRGDGVEVSEYSRCNHGDQGKKTAAQPPGLDNKIVGDSQLLAEISLPADLPEGQLDYVVVTPTGEASGKMRVFR